MAHLECLQPRHVVVVGWAQGQVQAIEFQGHSSPMTQIVSTPFINSRVHLGLNKSCAQSPGLNSSMLISTSTLKLV